MAPRLFVSLTTLALILPVLAAALTVVSTLTTSPVLWVLGGVLLLTLSWWLANLATDLLGRAAAA